MREDSNYLNWLIELNTTRAHDDAWIKDGIKWME